MKELSVCTRCWSGRYENGICSNCNQRAVKLSQRNASALPLMSTVRSQKTSYVIGDVLGQGGFGITYSAWDEGNHRRVALKEYFPKRISHRNPDHMSLYVQNSMDQSDDAQEDFRKMEKRFLQEPAIGKMVRQVIYEHGETGVVDIYDQFSCNGTSYYAMEFLEGMDLRNYVSCHGPMTWERLEPIAEKILKLLELVHHSNLIHRDISPDNIFLTKDNRIYLIDFGNMRFFEGNQHFTEILHENFAPYEQHLSNGRQGPWTDIYGLCATMYYLLTGKVPTSAADQNFGTAVIPIRQLVPQLPDRAVYVIEKGMQFKIENRFLSAGQMLAAMKHRASGPEISEKQPAGSSEKNSHSIHSKGKIYWIQGRKGVYKGLHRQLANDCLITVGRGAGCWVSFPDQTHGVSRNQCSLQVGANGNLFIRDENSRYGTYLNGRKLEHRWIQVPPGSILSFGNEEFYLLGE